MYTQFLSSHIATTPQELSLIHYFPSNFFYFTACTKYLFDILHFGVKKYICFVMNIKKCLQLSLFLKEILGSYYFTTTFFGQDPTFCQCTKLSSILYTLILQDSIVDHVSYKNISKNQCYVKLSCQVGLVLCNLYFWRFK